MNTHEQKKSQNVKKDYLKQRLHWYIMMAVVVVGVVVLLIRGVYIFLQMQNDHVFSSDESVAEKPIFSVQKLNEGVQYFNERNERYEQLLATPPDFADPS